MPQSDDRRRVTGLDDLNDLLDKHARGEDYTGGTSTKFMTKHGEFFPENPRDVGGAAGLAGKRAAAARRRSATA